MGTRNTFALAWSIKEQNCHGGGTRWWGCDEALSAKDMLCSVRGVALAPVLEALWICTEGRNRELLAPCIN